MHGEILKDLGECSDSAVKLKTEVWCFCNAGRLKQGRDLVGNRDHSL